MVAIKASLALPSLTKSASSRSSSPAPTPTPTLSNTGEKRGMLETGRPSSRSRSDEGNKRLLPGSIPIAHASVSSAGHALRPKLTSLLSGRSTPHHVSTTPVLSPSVGTFPTVTINGSATAPTPAPTPANSHGGSHMSAGALNGSVAVSTLEASYVAKVGMSLNDAVNKVFPSSSNFVAGVVSHSHSVGDAAVFTYKGLCAPRVERAKEVGQMVATELHLAINDQYLVRSLLRSAVLKSLSIFLSRLETLIISPSADSSVLYVAKSIKEAENPPPSQRFSFLVLRSAWELKSGLNKACSNLVGQDGKEEQMPRFVKDTLAPWITKLDLLANLIWNPILAAIKDEGTRLVACQGQDEASASQNGATSTHTSSARGLSLTRPGISNSASTLLGSSLNSAQPGSAAPPYLRDLSSFLSATSRTFAWLSGPDVQHQKWKVSIGSAIIWKMLLNTSSKRLDHNEGQLQSRSSPPPGRAAALHTTAVGNGAQVISEGLSVPLSSTRRSMSAMGIGRLRGSSTPSGKRSPSPTHGADHNAVPQVSKLIIEVEAFETILEKFVASLLAQPHEAGISVTQTSNGAPCDRGKECLICRGRYIPVDVEDSDDEEALPREAMQEAMTALSSFIVILRALATQPEPVLTLLKAISAVDNISLAPEICPNLIRALDTIPPLILLQTIVSCIPLYYGFRLPYELWSTTWRNYEKTMKGFHTGEEWVGEVGWELLKEVKRVYDNLVKEAVEEGQSKSKVDEDGWLNLLKLAITELAEVDDLDDPNLALIPSINSTQSASASH